MNAPLRRLASGLLSLALLGSLASVSAAQPAPYTAPGEVWDGHLWVEGVRVGLLNSQGRPVDPLEYNGTVYIPLRSAGEWMGCAVAWDQDSQTVTLTSGQSPKILDVQDLPVFTDQELADHTLRLEQGVTLQIKPDVTVTMDGKTLSFANAGGEAVYPAILDGVTYLPVRSIGELMGLDVTWYEGPKVQGHMDAIHLHAPVTEKQMAEMQTYLDQCRAICDQFDALSDQLRSSDAAQAQTALAAVKARLTELAQLPKPKVDFFVRYQKFLDAAVARAQSVAENGEDSITLQLALPQELNALQGEIPFIQGALDAL